MTEVIYILILWFLCGFLSYMLYAKIAHDDDALEGHRLVLFLATVTFGPISLIGFFEKHKIKGLKL